MIKLILIGKNLTCTIYNEVQIKTKFENNKKTPWYKGQQIKSTDEIKPHEPKNDLSSNSINSLRSK